MPNTTQQLVELLEPYLNLCYKHKNFDFCDIKDYRLKIDKQLLISSIIYLLTHDKEGKPVKENDEPCILGGESEELKKIKGRIKVYSCKSFLEDPENEFFDYEIARFKDFIINRDEYYKARAEARYAPKTKAQAFLSYENLTLATTDFEAFCKLLIGELSK